MIREFNIRKLYHPVQPAVSLESNDVVYEEMHPDPKLQPLIYCYWQLKTMQQLTEDFYYRVVADGCMDIFFNLDYTQENFVMGFSNAYTEFPLPAQFNYVGVRFLPAAFPQIFKINAAELTNRFENLIDITPHTSKFITSRFEPSLTSEQIRRLLDDYFVTLLSDSDIAMDKRFYGALDIILRHQGTLNIERELNTGISSRQLRRLFEFYIGDSAKTFSKVVRFQNILQAKPSSESLRKNKLFFDAGYYDQAHFIKEFKTLFGTTPSRAFQQ
jgi:hypothetical protein